MNKIRQNQGITLVALIITIIVLLIVAGVTINAIDNTNLIAKSDNAAETSKKKMAEEIINLKITNIQISNYVEKQKMPTLQELADSLCDDNEMEYVLTTSKNVASLGKLDKIQVGEASSIFTKLKAYPYEFEINSSLQLASIDGVKIANTPNTPTTQIVNNIKVYLDGELLSEIPDKSKGYYCESAECTNGAEAKFDVLNWKLSISNISTVNTTCTLNFTSISIYTKVFQNMDDEEKLREIFLNEEYMNQILENQETLDLIYETEKIRNVFESAVSESPDILEAMKKTDRYKVLQATGQYKNFYNDRCFVLGLSCKTRILWKLYSKWIVIRKF